MFWCSKLTDLGRAAWGLSDFLLLLAGKNCLYTKERLSYIVNKLHETKTWQHLKQN